ncbi:MAG: Rrf2 family transcriptional regulator [Planctomycetes bacterium]|nr:Rrf2 family transcriptional regulator [Planctomycetota bacterium]
MLQLTKRTEYGLIALTHLAHRAGSVCSVREICDSYPIPRRLVAEVLKDLCHAQLVLSHRGSSGGYSLARLPEAISVGDVVAALEGHPSLTSCASLGRFTAQTCNVERVCPIRSPIETLRVELWRMLSRKTLRDLLAHPVPALSAPSISASGGN